jgi:hypothetical protein
MNSKYQKFQYYKVTIYLPQKMTLKIMLEPFVFCLHHGVQFLTSNQISLYCGKWHQKMCTQNLLICRKQKLKNQHLTLM